MTVPRIAPMTVAHIRSAMQYENDMFGTEAWTESGYRDELADVQHRHYLVAEDADSGDLLGWGGIRVVGAEADIVTVGVVPPARRRGVARQLIAAMLAEAVDRQVREVFLEVRVDNDAARALYASEGFEVLGVRRGYYENGRVDAVTMRKQLGQP